MAQSERFRLVVPVVLIVVGALFLYANYRPAFDPWPILWTYWPLILIFIGLGKMWDSAHQRENPGAPRGSSVGLTGGMLAFVLVLIVLLWHGRAFSRDHRFASSVHHETRTVERQGAQSAHASLEVGAGQLTIGGGSSHFLDADFNYSESYGNPRVDYNVANGVGQLSVSQDGESTHFVGVSHNEWNLRFSNDVPLELKIDMGAGQGQLRLRDVPVTRLDLQIGAGQVDVDLTGDRKKDLDADIEGGVGQATIRLPKNVGVIAHASGGIGAVSSHGLKHDGDEYTNDAYGKTPATIHLKVEGGVGEVSLMQEP
jgi:uncharacterized protein DUF2154/cell wall-active antibiotic response 4TMS protein YvqF